jgi:hypothetical protein
VKAFPFIPYAVLGAVVLASCLGALAVLVQGRRDARPALRRAARVLLIGAVGAVALVTLFGGSGRGDVRVVPLSGIWSTFSEGGGWVGIVLLVGNVLLFVPVGFLIPLAIGSSWRRTLYASLALSTAIEWLQYGFGRTSDIDDVLLNSIGGGLGAAAGVWAYARWIEVGRPLSQPVDCGDPAGMGQA